MRLTESVQREIRFILRAGVECTAIHLLDRVEAIIRSTGVEGLVVLRYDPRKGQLLIILPEGQRIGVYREGSNDHDAIFQPVWNGLELRTETFDS